MAKIQWSRTASDAFADVVGTMRQFAGPEFADSLRQGIIVRVRLLRGFPELGKPIPEMPGSDVRELPVPPYRILYRIAEDAVIVLNILQSEGLPTPLADPDAPPGSDTPPSANGTTPQQ